MSTLRIQVDRAFAKIERRTERLLAFLRLLALLVLALVFWFVGSFDQGHATMLPLLGLGAVTLAGLAVAGSGLFRPWVPWLFATLDVVLLVHCLAMLAITTGQPLQLALETPAASVIFVFLAMAAIRHRPFLTLYTGGLFVAAWEAIWLLEPYATATPRPPQSLTTDLARLCRSRHHRPLHHRDPRASRVDRVDDRSGPTSELVALSQPAAGG
jgi:hypothetical protein